MDQRQKIKYLPVLHLMPKHVQSMGTLINLFNVIVSRGYAQKFAVHCSLIMLTTGPAEELEQTLYCNIAVYT